jgi:hypothetical protein
MQTLGDRVEAAMERAGIKARTFALLVGCHYTTIYELLRNRDKQVPIQIVQERVFSVLDFLSDAEKSGAIPLEKNLTVAQKTNKLKSMYDSYLLSPPKAV